jgi:acetyl esterase/lipase
MPRPRDPVLENLVYHREFGKNYTLDLYPPLADPPGTDPELPTPFPNLAPTVVFFHGGSWFFGRKETIRVIHRFVDTMREAGYAVVAIDYVSSIFGGFHAPLRRCRKALSWLADRSVDLGVDPESLGLYGVSAGGHLALMTAATLEDSRIAIPFVFVEYAPADLVAMAGGEAFERSKKLRWLPRIYLKHHSPIRRVGPDFPPTLVVHGTADRMVDIRQSERLVRVLEESGVETIYRSVPGGDHGLFNQPQSLWRELEGWALEHMRNYFGDG